MLQQTASRLRHLVARLRDDLLALVTTAILRTRSSPGDLDRLHLSRLGSASAEHRQDKGPLDGTPLLSSPASRDRSPQVQRGQRGSQGISGWARSPLTGRQNRSRPERTDLGVRGGRGTLRPRSQQCGWCSATARMAALDPPAPPTTIGSQGSRESRQDPQR